MMALGAVWAIFDMPKEQIGQFLHFGVAKARLKEQKDWFLHFGVAKVKLKEQIGQFLLFGTSEVKLKEQIVQFLLFGSKPSSATNDWATHFCKSYTLLNKCRSV